MLYTTTKVLALLSAPAAVMAGSSSASGSTCYDIKSAYQSSSCCNTDLQKTTNYKIAATEAPKKILNAHGHGMNVCAGKKPTGPAWDNKNCTVNGIVDAIEQAGANVTKGFVGGLATDAVPITAKYLDTTLCPVNVHWHLGVEHLSVGQYDEHGDGPDDAWASSTIDDDHRRLASADGVREGYQCRWYDETDPKFTTPYNWEHCIDMVVGQTYEVHWPHSKFGVPDPLPVPDALLRRRLL